MIPELENKLELLCERLEKPYQVQELFHTFIKSYPEDWKQHKINYSKFNRSKQFGRTIPLPKPEQSLKKTIQVWLLKNKKNAH
ncbi:hypothetical protein [Polaribacter pacificus]|uniref:hypothetical protein n=1 Tax=Polaribacter pacificus TaxID=1775173 RepID=UPI001664631F|nr:hypothetical protein [Polaribacter pacificus]